MPSYLRKAEDGQVYGYAVSAPTEVRTSRGTLTAQTGDWIITDFQGDHTIVALEKVATKYTIDPADPNSLSYYEDHAYEPIPVISRIEPTSGPGGNTLYIEGTHFLAQDASSKVYFGLVNRVEAVIDAWSPTLIEVTIPAGLPTSYAIEVRVETANGLSVGFPFQATA